MSPTHDYHVHSNYSDGRLLARMIRGAEEAGLDGVGFADHCTVSERDPQRDARASLGFNLDLTYERRRRGIELLAADADVDVYDAVEMDYHPRDEAEIRSFLDGAGFDYAVGSVHELDGANVHHTAYFEGKSEAERRDLVGTYFDRVVSLVESGLFDVAAHLDLVERNPLLRGLATYDQYERVADALLRSDTVPEVNAGRVLRDYGEFHPAPAMFDVLVEHGVEFTIGSDSHAPAEIAERTTALADLFEQRGLEPVRIVE